MTMDLVQGISKVTQLVKNCITSEMVPEGILHDVKSFIPSYRFEDDLDEPLIGLFEHKTEPVTDGTLSHQIELQTPYEFLCVVYDDDLEESEIKGKDLAGRVCVAIAKNFTRIFKDEKLTVKKPAIRSINPVGIAELEGTSQEAAVTSVVIEITYYVDWMKCIKKKYNENM